MFFPYISSPAEELVALKYNIRNNAMQNFNHMVEVNNDWIRYIFYNPSFDALTVVNALSSDAVNFFELTTNLRIFLSAAAIANDVSVNLLKPVSAFNFDGGVVNLINTPYVGP